MPQLNTEKMPISFVEKLHRYFALAIIANASKSKNALPSDPIELPEELIDAAADNAQECVELTQSPIKIAKELLAKDDPLSYAPAIISSMQTLFNLDDDQMRIVMLLAIWELSPLYHVLLRYNYSSFRAVLAQILGLPITVVDKTVSINNVLFKVGMLTECRYKGVQASRILTDIFSVSDEQTIHTYLSQIFQPIKPTQLELGDYSHVKPKIDRITHLLERNDSCNILIYGPPGCGKTELVKVLAQHMQRSLYQIQSSLDKSDTSPNDRLSLFYQAQYIFNKQQSMLLFDEVEEIFSNINSKNSFDGDRRTSKSTLNDLIENNKIPTIWIGNSIDTFDEAVIRRFDTVIKIDYPDIATRELFLRYRIGDYIENNTIDQISRRGALGFSQIDGMATLFRTLFSLKVRILFHTPLAINIH